MTEERFPMSTVRRVRDGRHILLWPDPAEWPFDEEEGAKGYQRYLLPNGAVIAYWSRDNHQWFISEEGQLRSGYGFNAIDDDFLAWANLTPIDGES